MSSEFDVEPGSVRTTALKILLRLRMDDSEALSNSDSFSDSVHGAVLSFPVSVEEIGGDVLTLGVLTLGVVFGVVFGVDVDAIFTGGAIGPSQKFPLSFVFT